MVNPNRGFMDGLPEEVAAGPVKIPLRAGAASAVRGVVAAAINAKVDFDVDMQWLDDEASAYGDDKTLQARAPVQPPVVLHPATGEPTWFCNVHSHSRVLRDERDGKDLAESSGASKLNRTNMYYGDLSEIPEVDLRAIDEAVMRNLVKVPMKEGDVVLVDNYQVMHGRDIFEGERLHAVTWFE